jgi:PAS domain S-box-containing protein
MYPAAIPPPIDPNRPPGAWHKRWWRGLGHARQDRYAMVAPLIAVLLFLAAIVTAFSYLRLEEMDREQEAVKRDVEYAQQRLRLRLLERQEQLMRLAAEVSNKQIDTIEFIEQAEALVQQYPELQSVHWIDVRKRIKMGYTTPSALAKVAGESIKVPAVDTTFDLARDVRQPVYSTPFDYGTGTFSLLQVQVPLADAGRFNGVVVGEYQIDGLMRYAVPTEISAKYAVALLGDKGQMLAGNTTPARTVAAKLLPWTAQAHEYEVPVSPVGNGLMLRAQAYRTSLGVVGSGLFWLVAVLSLMTAWMLVGTWRHTRKRIRAQAALVTETNFRRAMENSMLTGMRALDIEGRITYVNPAFCQMTLWNERELVGRTAPFPYWPDEDRALLTSRLEDELSGRTVPGGFQMRVKRKDNSQFDARMYVSPLIDSKGGQTGWMTSMTDITEPNRVRQQLTESYERFTTVLEGLDASVSVAPLGSQDLLFANQLYRQWFGSHTEGHLNLVAQAGRPDAPRGESDDDVDTLAGLPVSEMRITQSENAEIYVPSLGKWLEVRSRYLSWTDGRLAQMVIATDITPRRMAEAQSAAQAERAQTASRLITMGEMASSVAHELNQPLTAISLYCNGMVDRIKGKQINDEDLLAALEKTGKQAQRAGQIIQRIRNFVKRSEPNRTLSDISTMVGEAVELAEIELRRRNVRLSHSITPQLPQLLVDPILIEQVLVNLMKNAAESVDTAGREVTQRSVELRVQTQQMPSVGPVVEFTVTDTGKGLAPEVMQRLYEAFFSTKAEGMGIGLNLCRSIVESHQGRMQAENLYNGAEIIGCKFSFWLPVTQAAQDAAKMEPAIAMK